MEVSSHALHQDRVAGVEFSVGIFTNLTGDHLDYHKTMDEYAAAKAMLFEGLSDRATAVVNVDDAWTERMLRACARGAGQVVTFGIEGVTLPGAQWTGTIEEMKSDQMRLRVRGPDVDRLLVTPLVGRHNAYNLLSVISAAQAAGVQTDAILSSLGRAIGAPGRLQRVALNGSPLPFQVFVDYAHTHDALENVLKALRATMGRGRLLCVFGCGGDRDRTKRPKMGRVAETLADRVFVTSDNPRTEDPGFILGEICTGFTAGWKQDQKVTVEPDRRAAIRAAIDAAGEGDVVLIAGKGHENYQIIGTAKHHFDDVEEAAAALASRLDMKAASRELIRR
jgi:UDP-N-acetylmuramoyl-L-alanyl-D-glutamate--2,6-diaminopimelate ligase